MRARLDRREAVAALLAARGDLLVVAGLGSPAYDLMAAGDHDGNFYLWGGMGSAVPIALGLALARPDRPVLALTGDGEMLMGLGALATVARAAPRNLTVVVLDNGRYGETGMQESHTASGTKLAEVAKACGFRRATTIQTLKGIADLRRNLRATGGPRFATVAIVADNAPRVLPPRDGVFLKTRLRASLGLRSI
ncbi:MAG: aldehyde dehydrogenase [Alphaproteobacteria bacterium]|nr:aldehyde dehydrogenase [Alphaproteobacteria bacterium]